MSKKNCNIVLDLLPGYIENDLTEDTKEFVEEHIKNCSNCKNTLENMRADIIKQQSKQTSDTKIEVEKIKKVRKNLKAHKTILIVSSIIILLIAIVLLGTEIYYKFNKTLSEKIVEQNEINMNLNNYHFIHNYSYTVYNEKGSFNLIEDIYYKDEEFKANEYFEYKDTGIKTTTIIYGKLGEEEVTKVNVDDNTIIEGVINSYYSGIQNMLDFSGYSWSLRNYFKDINYEDVEIRNFEEKEWYVYKTGNEEEYIEYWIDKDNLTDFRYIEANSKYCRESLYTLEKDIVTDKNMEIDYDTTDFEHMEFLS